MKKKIKVLMFLGTMCLVLVIMQPLSAFNQANVMKKPIKPLKFAVDVYIRAISVEQCLCENDLSRNFNALAPKKVAVILYNEHTRSVKVETTLTYYNLANKKITIKRISDLPSKRTRWVTFINSYKLIKKSSRISAYIRIIDSRYSDKNTSNNKKSIKECPHMLNRKI